MAKKAPIRTPVIFLLVGALAVSLVLNLVFLVISYRRNIVVSVPDGDSIQLADGRRVRLLGVDAPEKGMCMGEEARVFLEAYAKGRHVRLKETVTDSYGRTLAIAIIEEPGYWFRYLRWRYVGGRSGQMPDPVLNRVILRNGMARFTSSGGQYNQVLKNTYNVAKTSQIGIFSDICRGQEGENGCTIKGNLRAGTRYFYPSECRVYGQVIVDTAFGDRWFCTDDEAREAGFTLAPACE